MSKETHIGNYVSCIRIYTYVVQKSRLIKIIWRLTNGKESWAAQVVGCTSHARACRYINERDKKEEQKNLRCRQSWISRGADYRCAQLEGALYQHHGHLFLCLFSATQRDDEIRMRASLYIYIFFFSTASTAGRVKNLTTVRVREYEECITGTGASKAAFPGYDARCVRREQWKWICLSFCVWKFWAAMRQCGMLPQKRRRNE